MEKSDTLNQVEDFVKESLNLIAVLNSYRKLMGHPQASGTECEAYATIAVRSHNEGGAALKSRISTGRQEVLQGLRPKLVDAIRQVLGASSLSSPEIYDALKQRGWAPLASHPISYISFTLSSNPKLFERVRRGVYRVPSSVPDPSAELRQLLQDLGQFPDNLSLIEIAPESVQKRLRVKDSRKQLIAGIANGFSQFSPEEQQNFLRDLDNPFRQATEVRDALDNPFDNLK